MGEIENELRKLITNRYGSIKNFAEITNIPYTTLSSIFQRGITNAKVTNIIKIAKELEVNTDELVFGKIVPIHKKNEISTIAAHFTGDEYTANELEEIRQFAEFVKSKREKKDSSDRLTVQAAHERTEIDVTDEMRQHDDDIMNDENF